MREANLSSSYPTKKKACGKKYESQFVKQKWNKKVTSQNSDMRILIVTCKVIQAECSATCKNIIADPKHFEHLNLISLSQLTLNMSSYTLVFFFFLQDRDHFSRERGDMSFK